MYALYALFLCCVVAALDANKDIYIYNRTSDKLAT